MPTYHLECFLFQWEVPGTHNPQATTPLCWCHGVFTDRFIFRLNFPRKRLYLDGTFLTLEGRKERVESLCAKVESASLHSGALTFSDGLLLSLRVRLTFQVSCRISVSNIASDDSALGLKSSCSRYLLTWVTFRRYCTPSAPNENTSPAISAMRPRNVSGFLEI